MTTEEKQTFESLVDEFRRLSHEDLENEVVGEGYPLGMYLYPGTTQPYDASGPPFKSPWVLTEPVIKAYAASIGDDNPLYTDSEYAKSGPYGCLIAPGTALIIARNAMWHGARRVGGWPIANFHSGTAWEFFDVLRVGTGFKTSSVGKEIIEKPGAHGNLFFFITDVNYWDMRGDLLGKCYGTLIMVPREEMGTGRAMSVERLGERMMYERNVPKLNAEQVEEILDLMEKSKPRGKEVLYWEDVNEGDKLPTFIIPPWTDQDWTATAQAGATSSRAVTRCAGTSSTRGPAVLPTPTPSPAGLGAPPTSTATP